MTEEEQLAVLNQAFVRIYRSYGEYVREACPNFDVGDEAEFQALFRRQKTAVRRLGEYIIDKRGMLDKGQFRLDLGQIHFTNVSFLLPTWIAEQEKLAAELESDLQAIGEDAGTERSFLIGVVANERDLLAKLKAIEAGAAVAA